MAGAMPPGQAQLVSAARDGDRDALERLLALSQPDIRRYARRNCKRAEDIDDAVQDTMLVVHRRIGALADIAAFPFWVMVIVTRACWRLARMGLGHAETLEVVANDWRFARTDPLELRLAVAGAIESLPQHYRDIVILRDVEEHTIDEIAALRNLTRESVKARLHRARQLIREYLKE